MYYNYRSPSHKTWNWLRDRCLDRDFMYTLRNDILHFNIRILNCKISDYDNYHSDTRYTLQMSMYVDSLMKTEMMSRNMFFFSMARQPYMGLGLLVSSRFHGHTL